MSLDIDVNAYIGEFALALKTTLSTDRITAISGVSGSGKTTLLRCIAGLCDYTGSVILNGEPLERLPAHRRGIGYVFQDNRLLPHLDVRGNLEFALRRRTRNGPTLADISDRFQIDHLLTRNVATLSGGEAKRVAIARAVLCGPKLLLLDEPLNGLDESAADQILSILQHIPDWLACAMIYVSHARRELAQLADDVVLLEGGKLLAQGDVRTLSTNIELQHDDAGAIVEGVLARHDDAFGLSEVTVEGQSLWVTRLTQNEGSKVRLLLAARDVSLARAHYESSILNCLPCEIENIRELSVSQVLLRLTLGNQALLARITRKSLQHMKFKKGDTVLANIKSVAVLK